MQLGHIAKQLGCDLIGDETLEIERLAPIDLAGSNQLTGFFSPRWSKAAKSCRASAVLVHPRLQLHLPGACARLLTDDPRAAWGQAIRLFHTAAATETEKPKISQLADVDPSSHIGDEVHIASFVHVGRHAKVGDNCIIHSGAYIGAEAVLGPRTEVMPHAQILEKVVIGAMSWIGPGAVIGSHGFGLDKHGRLPHLGGVIVGNQCTIGAQTCVDRGTVGDTVIGQRCHLDNLVQIGHNVKIGNGVVICGQAGIAGGATIGDGVTIGGQAGITGHVRIAANIRIAAQAGVTRSLTEPGDYSGHPAEPNGPRLRRLVKLRRWADKK